MVQMLVKGIGQIVMVALQIVMAMVCVYLLSVLLGIFIPTQTYTAGIWSLIIFSIWLGFSIGIFAVGWFWQRMGWLVEPWYVKVRLAFTAGAVLLPLFLLLLIGLKVGPGPSMAFQEQILNDWQPKLSFLSMGFGIIGFYLPGRIKKLQPAEMAA